MELYLCQRCRRETLPRPTPSERERLSGALCFRRANGSLGVFHQYQINDGLQYEISSYSVATRIFRRDRLLLRPRNVGRHFRTDNDEPATGMSYRLTDKQCVCHDGQDRSRCSSCQRDIRSTSRSETISSRGPLLDRLPPERIFRDLLMSDVEEPLPPGSRDALLAAFNQTVTAAEPSPSSSVPRAKHFELFPMLPFEIRRLIWVAALPERVLEETDLSAVYNGESNLGRHSQHSLDELWRSDLFYACREARDVVESFQAGNRRIGITSDTRLLASQDVLYHPWRGSGTGHNWTKNISRSGVAPECMALDVGWLDKFDRNSLEWLAMNTSLASVKVVVADILVPLRIPLGPESSLWRDASGMDFTVLVGLYDDHRIQEMLSLQDPPLSPPLNKAARHRCIDCTRRAWEERDWSTFGEIFGNKLKALSRPSIVFSVTLGFTLREPH